MSDTQIKKRVVVEVPPDVAKRARQRSNSEDGFEEMLLDDVLFEYEWRVGD